jgi:CheY-like chemotaxis protein
LVVDDDPEVRGSVRVLLEAYGYAVREAEDGRAALNDVEIAPPDLILTDIYMPGSDGFEVINELREIRNDIPVIAMSGGSKSLGLDQLELAEKLGAVGIIDKPFRDSNLLEMIDRAIAKRRG